MSRKKADFYVMYKMGEMEKSVYFAIRDNNAAHLCELVNQGADVDMIFYGTCPLTSSTWAALHLCCEKGHYECADVLLEHGADPNITDKYGQTPLMYAVGTEWIKMIPLLVKHGADVNSANMTGQTALHRAVSCSDTQCLDALVGHGADLDACDRLSRTPLHLACHNDGHLEHIQHLLDAGCNINHRDAKDKHTPLQAAIKFAKKDRLAYIQLLISRGASVEIMSPKDHGNHTALMTLLHITWHRGSYFDAEELELARLFLDISTDVNVVAGINYKQHLNRLRGPALKLAVERGVDQVTDWLLEAGAKPNVTDDHGCTPLHIAALHNRIEVMKKLLYHNADPDCRGALRLDCKWHIFTPFSCALYRCQLEAAQLLVHAGYDLQKETYLLTNQNVPNALVQNLEFWLWLKDMASMPVSLMLLCRKNIRQYLGHKILKSVLCLHLPPTITDFILMKELMSFVF